LDAGASTGGFTDCLLQNGAKFVYSVDVGYGQFAWKLRIDNRVKVVEKTNLKICKYEDIYSENDVLPDLLVMDVSFISIEKVLPNLKNLLNKDFHEMICLIKPQFEAGKEQIEKGGVVKDKFVHIEVINNVSQFIKNLGYVIKDLTYSSIKGPSGNIEYLIYFATEGQEKDIDINKVVADAFTYL
jgi:23S rRNA (cytidine1920-2'-O)/16S rRNA (cytidine1409-2'-O)-methyltransferase